MRVMLSIGRYFKRRFGTRVRKIPISLQGFTCPNIDGSLAKGGCIYCDNESFSPSLIKLDKISEVKMNFSLTHNPLLQKQLKQLEEQFYWHSEFHQRKFGVCKYMIYFQSYTNTYAPYSTLKALYDKALSFPNVVGLSIGTRIDCVKDEVLELLGEYVKKGKEIWLEYGIQSVYDNTLTITNRAHSITGAKEMFAKTREKGVKVCAHLIYGLPEETPQMMLHSLESVLEWGIDGIKIHPLYVVNGTRLAKLYKDGKYEPITMESFSDLIVKSLQKIPPDVVVQRISAGAHDESLLAPKWCFDKNIQMRYLRDRLKEVGIEY
ncbi:TIGR01212 family radical SAM protein [Helicobacter sp. MIT 03-1614]|uniref:TIGR01212 family radical SAM protein n=1 Tax=unclassified Helicobacter TaxID=2593540 RepID=UPI0005142AEF|nr:MULTISPECIES: TIGR01212 family radical SAM protein [unclassified Helicobacter]TLD89621.1 TIGR01212 family radical SAM protein [Helicobacter sp. MIT 03-1614]